MKLKITQIYLSLILACFSFFVMNGQDVPLLPHDLDPAFTSPFANDFATEAYCVAVQPDGKIIVSGAFTTGTGNNNGGLVRLNEDGSLNQEFTIFSSGNINALLILPDGKIVVGGIFTIGSAQYCIARLNADGSLDETFTPVASNSAFADTVFSMALQSDGKIVAGGSFEHINGIATANLVRINTNGSVDTTLNLTEGAGTTGFSSTVNSVAVLPDGKILALGSFNYFSAISAKSIARLNADGSLDTTFTTGFDNNSELHSIHVKADGKLLVGGYFVNYNGVPITCLASLNANGTLDTTFNVGGSGAMGLIRAIAVDAQGKILIGGSLFSYNGQPRISFAKLNSDGTLDDSFNHYTTGTAYYNGFMADVNSEVRSIALQGDGKILAAGHFNKYKSTTMVNVARLMGGEVLSTDTFAKNKVSYYPNPVNDKLYINSADVVTGVKIVSLTGQAVMEITTASGLDAINVTNLQAGCYVVHATTESGTANFKIIKE